MKGRDPIPLVEVADAEIAEIRRKWDELGQTPAVQERLAGARLEAEREWQQTQAAELVAQVETHIPRRFRTAETDRPEIDEWVTGYLERRPDLPSLLLIGATGTGKTHTAYAAIRRILEARRWHRLICYSSPMLLNDLRPGGREGLFAYVCNASLLFLDDFGTEKYSEWVAEQLYAIIDARYADMRPTILTSNVLPANFSEVFGGRLTSRLNEMCVKVALSGPDRRYQ